jgi:hypothetical protein
MALHWNVSACAESARSEEGWTLTNALIWATMFIGINRITEKNVEEFYGRLSTYEQLFSPLTYIACGDHAEKNYTTFDQLKARIGLSTNATTLTRVKFVKNLASLISLEIDKNIRAVRDEQSKLQPWDAEKEAV